MYVWSIITRNLLLYPSQDVRPNECINGAFVVIILISTSVNKMKSDGWFMRSRGGR
jgi:hypothetical protein